ncbi:MAG: hypothetical protein NWF04_02860 [Candidatus Bathyarchaeota archaeon]|nr:hypothetical protein [Candidatus Bathyarchaeota archaeon]
MKKKVLTTVSVEDDLLVDLTFHNVPASLIADFTAKVVKPYYAGSLTCALKDLMQKAVADQEFVQNHITR